MKKLLFAACILLGLFVLTGCGEESKIDGVKKTVINNCQGKTMDDLAAGLLQNPVWGYEKHEGGKQFVTVNGTIAGDKLPGWIKEQKRMDITFRFALDPKTDKYNPADLEGFPSLSTPEGVLQAYKTLVCN